MLSAISVGVKFLRLARSLSFSSFRNAAWTAPSIDMFVNNDSTSRYDLVADFFLIDVTSASKTHQTNPLEAKRCEFAQDTPITPKFYEHHVLFYSSCSSFKGHVIKFQPTVHWELSHQASFWYRLAQTIRAHKLSFNYLHAGLETADCSPSWTLWTIKTYFSFKLLFFTLESKLYMYLIALLLREKKLKKKANKQN